MANRTFYPSNSYGSSRVYCEFTFTAPGAGTSVLLSNVDGADAVASITHVAGTNVCTVTLKDTFFKVISHSCDVRDNTPNGAYCTMGTFTNEGTKTPPSFNINFYSAAGVALNDSVAQVVVTLALKNANWGVK
jgi:hypothetical protein